MLTCAAVACCVAVAQAQGPAQRDPNSGDVNSNQPSNPQAVTANKLATTGTVLGRGDDQTIATMLAIGNQEEVAMAHLAETKIQNPDVRSFADLMIHDHTQFLTKLAQFGGYAGFTGNEPVSVRGRLNELNPLPRNSNAPEPTVRPVRPNAPAGQAQLQAGQPAQVQGAHPAVNRPQFNFLSVKRQIAEACLASAQKDLESKKPFEAEMDYVGSQIVAHKQMLDTLKVLRPYASAEFQPVLDQGMQTVQIHLQHAEKLVKSLARAHTESSGSSTGTNR
jgi:predicted outer membrane protein